MPDTAPQTENKFETVYTPQHANDWSVPKSFIGQKFNVRLRIPIQEMVNGKQNVGFLSLDGVLEADLPGAIVISGGTVNELIPKDTIQSLRRISAIESVPKSLLLTGGRA